MSEAQARDAAQDHRPAEEGRLLTDLLGVAQGATAQLRATLRLALLESRQAAISFALMVGLALAVAQLSIVAWLLANAAWAQSLMAHGHSLGATLVISAALNGVLAVTAFLVAVRLSRNLRFPATRRQLRVEGAGVEAHDGQGTTSVATGDSAD